MKKLMTVTGIILIVSCVLALLLAAWNLYAYYHVLDGSAAMYARLHHRASVFFFSGIGLALAGALCMVVRTKL
ncbi:MAG: hypothetical protein J5822_08710 [Eubacteriaceae bacterium]|nr:hypothetical protein [Eubacteriaceae bacterium]